MKLINKGISLIDKFTATRLNALSNSFHHAVKYENVSAVEIFLSNGTTIEDAEKLLEQTHNKEIQQLLYQSLLLRQFKPSPTKMLESTTNKIFALLENILSDVRCNYNNMIKNKPIITIENKAVHLVV